MTNTMLLVSAVGAVIFIAFVIGLICGIRAAVRRKNNIKTECPEYSVKDRAAIELIAALADVLNELEH